MTENIKDISDIPEVEIIDEIERPKGDPLSIADFNERIQSLGTPEEKLQEAILYMRASISTSKNPYFKGFWEGSKTSLALFKENIAPQIRTLLWTQYRDLCQEFRKLKQVLDEQSEFAAEQISLAIVSLNTELANFDELIKKQAPISFSSPSTVLDKNFEIYNSLQTELNLLNAYASRINSLRKELIKTEMRIRLKNKFFKDLSQLGDKIFPRRKELIKTISQTFIEDVDTFITTYFDIDSAQAPLFFIREEIKSLQGIAKFLTLNTQAFNETRTKLSECWDAVRTVEKEKKKEFQEKRGLFKQNEELVLAEINAVKEEFTPSNIHEKIDSLFDFMRTVELGRDERKSLKEAIYVAADPILLEIRKLEEERVQKEQELTRQKTERVQNFRTRIQNFIENMETLSLEAAIQEKDTLQAELQTLPCSKPEKMQLEKSLKPLKDLLNDKKEKMVLQLSQDDQNSLGQLKEILKQRKERRKEIKTLIDDYRKSSGSSSLSFEKALAIKEALQEEKLRLEKIDAGIEEIEDQIKKLSA